MTGAGRGIGFKLVETLSARPNTIVFAGVRSFPPLADEPLARLAATLPTVVYPVKMTSAHEADNFAAARVVEENVGKVDVIIANAGENLRLRIFTHHARIVDFRNEYWYHTFFHCQALSDEIGL